MELTSKQVQGDVYQMLRSSALASLITGSVYRDGTRPRDSRLEDAVVTFTAGLPDQIQTGAVTVNIYVPDIDPFANGVFVEDIQRTAELERAASDWVATLTADKSCYKFRLMMTIYTEAEAAINQHFVVVKLKYEYFD